MIRKFLAFGGFVAAMLVLAAVTTLPPAEVFSIEFGLSVATLAEPGVAGALATVGLAAVLFVAAIGIALAIAGAVTLAFDGPGAFRSGLGRLSMASTIFRRSRFDPGRSFT